MLTTIKGSKISKKRPKSRLSKLYMDALKLYNLDNVQKEKVYTLPKKKQKIIPAVKNQLKLQYICYSCKAEVKISSSEAVFCNNCQSRIVYKASEKKQLVYKSI